MSDNNSEAPITKSPKYSLFKMAPDTNTLLLVASIVIVTLLSSTPSTASGINGRIFPQTLTLADLLNVRQRLTATSDFRSKLASIEDISPKCAIDFAEYEEILESLLPKTKSLQDNPDKKWALALLDATGRIQTGLLDGNLNWMGSFTECLRIRAYRNQTFEERFRGQYCTLNLIVQLPSDTALTRHKSHSLITLLQAWTHQNSSWQIKSGRSSVQPLKEIVLSWGVCWMSSCNNKEIEILLTTLVKEAAAALQIKLPDFIIESDPSLCRIQEDSPKFDTVSIAVICLYSAFGLLVLLSTIYDVYCIMRNRFAKFHMLQDIVDRSDDGGILSRTLLSFSCYRNGKRILSTESSGSLTCIHGIRFFTMAWVVLSHVYMYAMAPNGLAFKNGIDELNVPQSYVVQPILNGSFATDTFYTISGLLVTYLFLREMKNRGGRFGLKQLFLYYFHRYWRLTPIYAMGIAFIAGIWYHVADGPLWTQRLAEQDRCRKYWWRNLLYIQNLYDIDNKCYDVAWYLGTDMQFYAVALPILLALYKVPVLGLVLMAIYFVTTIVTSALTIYIRDLPGTLIENVVHLDLDALMRYMKYVYMVPWCRMSPYLVGMFTGYSLYRNKTKTHLNQTVIVIGWLLSTALGLVNIFGYYSYNNGDLVMPRWLRAVYGPGSRTSWGLIISWVVYACVVGHGGIVNAFLSWKAFVPLSRLTYSAYLVHYYPLLALYTSQENVFYFSHYMLILFFLGIMATTMAIAFVFSLAFESPMIELEKIFLRKPKTDDEPLPPISVDSVSQYVRPYIPRVTATKTKRNISRM